MSFGVEFVAKPAPDLGCIRDIAERSGSMALWVVKSWIPVLKYEYNRGSLVRQFSQGT